VCNVCLPRSPRCLIWAKHGCAHDMRVCVCVCVDDARSCGVCGCVSVLLRVVCYVLCVVHGARSLASCVCSVGPTGDAAGTPPARRTAADIQPTSKASKERLRKMREAVRRRYNNNPGLRIQPTIVEVDDGDSESVTPAAEPTQNASALLASLQASIDALRYQVHQQRNASPV